ncbi:alpha/beta fold hydrolase [Mycobacterium palustre]|uniref:Alpha/beta hydrolase n=1 Tax=Mycobacterium palustre TaxID=153971 RepID=A0A1X1ZC28_9MYCO|nr:alpha/beta hydrolase [Mycobacterium palustre]MCV7103233.1 alpha/beta hydrolase [Mycobacterium palustre]ORW20967.1 alpha/beta hydrolase [Mycobacterium palustre]
MFTQPELTTGSNAYRTSSPPRPPRLPVRRDGYVERTVIASDGVRLAVRDYGSSGARDHTVVLLHGLCLTQASWALQVRHLVRQWGDRVRIITYDHRGHGESSGADMHTYRIDRLADDLADVLTALRVRGPLTLAGHSMGGMTALAYLGRPAADRPVEPQGLVLVATAAGRLTERGLGRFLGSRATGMLFDLVHRIPRRADQTLGGLVRPVYGALLRYSGAARKGAAAVTASAIHTISLTTAAGFLPSLQRYDQYDALASIAADTVVISGGADLTTPAEHARDLAAAIPGATHLHRPAAGHMLLEEDPQCVSEAIDGIIGKRRPYARGVAG